MGSISSPDSAAEVPEDICRNVGTKAIAENMPRPRVNPMAVALTKIRLRNRLSGMMGSSARRSTITKAAADRTMPAPKAQVRGESQPSSFLPPKSVKKMRQVVAADSSTTPRMSIRFSAFLLGSVRVNQAMANAAMPMGMLM